MGAKETLEDRGNSCMFQVELDSAPKGVLKVKFFDNIGIVESLLRAVWIARIQVTYAHILRIGNDSIFNGIKFGVLLEVDITSTQPINKLC